MIFQDPVMFVYKWDPSCLEMFLKKALFARKSVYLVRITSQDELHEDF